MQGKTFRAMATYAVDQVAKALDEFPETYIVMRLKGRFGTIIVGLEGDDPAEVEVEVTPP